MKTRNPDANVTEISSTSFRQAKDIYYYILGDLAKQSPRGDIAELAEYLDVIKKNYKKYNRKQK